MKNKVEIKVERGHKFKPSINNGCDFTSVGFNANTYGMGYPCKTEQSVNSAIKHAKEWIRKNGDIPIVVGLETQTSLTGF